MPSWFNGKIKIALTSVILVAIAVGGVAFKESKGKRVHIYCSDGPGLTVDKWENLVIANPSYFKGYCDVAQNVNVQAAVPIRPSN